MADLEKLEQWKTERAEKSDKHYAALKTELIETMLDYSDEAILHAVRRMEAANIIGPGAADQDT